MSEENSGGASTTPAKPARSYNSKPIKKGKKYMQSVEEDRKYDELRRKYANAIIYLLIKNVPQSGLRSYFNENDENRKRYESLKRFRAAVLEARPRAKQWVDKPFYLGIKLGSSYMDDAGTRVELILGECCFKQRTSVISTKYELEGYMDTIQKIIESERIWADPDMADFDVGERDDVSAKFVKKMKKLEQGIKVSEAS